MSDWSRGDEFYVILLDDYTNDPEHCVWMKCDGWVSDFEDAAQFFMEDYDDYGSFGKGESSEHELAVLIWSEEHKKAAVVEVRPDPSPGYSKSELDDETSIDYYDVDVEKVKKPTDV